MLTQQKTPRSGELENDMSASTPTLIRQTTVEVESSMTVSNQSQFDILLSTFAPDLFIIWNTMMLYKINPQCIPPIVRAMGELAHSNKLGEVIIEVRPDKETGEAKMFRVRTNDTHHTNLSILK